MKEYVPVSEKFSNVKLWSSIMTIGNKEISILLLTSNLESLRSEFATVCSEFVDSGVIGEQRELLIGDPSQWWTKWKTLLGNAVYEKTPYSILGELIVLSKLIQDGYSPNWTARNKSTQDIEIEGYGYEVKSTLMRFDNTITINSQFQLEQNNSQLYLVFCKFEPSDNGYSISDVADYLVSQGMNQDMLNTTLSKMGFEAGSSARSEKYKLLEIRKYLIDDDFPKITLSSFKDNSLPPEIFKLTYQIDLSGIEYDAWDEFYI